jgi:hypothetical protein
MKKYYHAVPGFVLIIVIVLAVAGCGGSSSSSSSSSSTPTVYTAGYYSDGSKEIPCYWKGTTLHALAGDGKNNARAMSIFVK